MAWMADLPPALTQARQATVTWRSCLQSILRVRATTPPSLLRLHRQVPAHASLYLQPRDRDRSLTQSCPHRQSLSASLLSPKYVAMPSDALGTKGFGALCFCLHESLLTGTKTACIATRFQLRGSVPARSVVASSCPYPMLVKTQIKSVTTT